MASKKIREKRFEKMQIIKEDQIEICQFVNFKYSIIKKKNGKWKHQGVAHGQGLQIKNKIYMNNGKYKLVNNKNLKIKKVYEEIPQWANAALIKKYELNQ